MDHGQAVPGVDTVNHQLCVCLSVSTPLNSQTLQVYSLQQYQTKYRDAISLSPGMNNEYLSPNMLIW